MDCHVERLRDGDLDLATGLSMYTCCCKEESHKLNLFLKEKNLPCRWFFIWPLASCGSNLFSLLSVL